MHESVHAWVAGVVERHGLAGRRVLDVGSMDVNGTCRDHFRGPYLGVDIRPGPGVDAVTEPGGRLPEGPWGVIVCTEVLEHDVAPWRTLSRMWMVAEPGGLLLLTCSGIGFPLHEHPGDHWRFSRDGVAALLTDNGWQPLELVDDPQHPGVFALAIRP